LEIIFNTGKTTHRVKKSTRIWSNDPADSLTRVWIMADVRREPDRDFQVRISPKVLEFAREPTGENLQMRAGIKNVTSRELHIRIVDMPSELVDATLSAKTIAPSKEIELRVKLKKKAKQIDFTKSITLELDDGNESRFTIPIKNRR